MSSHDFDTMFAVYVESEEDIIAYELRRCAEGFGRHLYDTGVKLYPHRAEREGLSLEELRNLHLFRANRNMGKDTS